jgi:fructoselysine 3-epimerase
MKTALSSFVFLYSSLEDAIRKTAGAGYEGIDIWGGRPHAYRTDLQRFETQKVNRLLKELNLTVASFIPAQFRYPTCLCSPNETIRQDSVAYILDSIETAATLNAPVVSVCPGHTLEGQTIQDAWTRLEDSLIVICERAGQYGIQVALEPADRYETDLMNTVETSMQMIHKLDIYNLGVVLDSGHVHLTPETFTQAVQLAGERLFHVHVDDNQGLRDQHLVPGQGNCDFKELFTALKAIGYRGFLSVELGWDYILDPLKPALESLKLLKSRIND